MTNEAEDAPVAALSLRVTAELEPSALPRVLACFQNLNLIPQRVIAELGTRAEVHIRVDVFGMPEERLSLIAAKIGQMPGVANAYWHRL